MRLIEDPLEANIRQAFLNALEELEPGTGGAGTAPPPSQIRGNKVYVLGLRGLVAKDAPARHIGWQCLTGQQAGVIGGDVPLNGLRASRKLGPAVEKATAAYAALGELAQAQIKAVAGYQVRVLRIPDLRLEAFWLKAEPFDSLTLSPHDLIYPFVSYHREFPENQPVRGDRFLELARKLAEVQIASRRPGV